MAAPKMRPTQASVTEYLNQIEHERKRTEAYQLLELFTEVTGYPPVLWGDSIIGFGTYHYTYPSGREGDAPLVGFASRKAKIVLYIIESSEDFDDLLSRLGKHTSSKACIYVNKLSDINLEVVKEMIDKTIDLVKAMYPINR